jgi:uncharacterized protein
MKQLPEKIALDKAIHGARLYQGSIKLNQFARLKDAIADTDGEVQFSLQFEKARGTLGKVQVKVTGDLPLICQISQKRFIFPVDIDSTVGFINDIEYEDKLDVGMEASWLEHDYVKPLEVIEDELILVVPYLPISPEEVDKQEKMHTLDKGNAELEENVKPNPFDILKSLK